MPGTGSVIGPRGLAQTPQSRALSRPLAAAKAADKRYETTRLGRRKNSDQDHELVAGIRVPIAALGAQELRLDSMIQAQMVKLDG